MISLNNSPTEFHELNEVLVKLCSGIQKELESNLLGFYLQGSFALGDADEWSDVDFIVVTQNVLKQSELDNLQKLHQEIYKIDSNWAKHLEGSYFPLDVISNPERVGEPVPYLDNGSTHIEMSNHCNDLVVRWIMAKHGITIFGSQPEYFIPVPSSNLLKENALKNFVDWSDYLLNNPKAMNQVWEQAFVVISFCRVLQTLETGEIHSKKAGVDWALKNFDSRWIDLINLAWKSREKNYQKPLAKTEKSLIPLTREFVQYCLSLIK